MIKVKLLSKSQSAFDIFPFSSSVTFIYEILPPPAIYSFQINCWLGPSGKWCGGESINIFYKHKTILTLVWRLWPRIPDTSYSSWKQIIYLALLVNPLLPHIRPEHHPGLEMEIHSTWGSRSSYNICLKKYFFSIALFIPCVVDDGGHAGPVQGELPDVRLVSEEERWVTLPGLALGVILWHHDMVIIIMSWHGDNNNVTQSTAGDNGQINIKDNIPGDPGHSLEHTHTCKEGPDIFKIIKKLNFPFLFLLSPDAAQRCRPGHRLAATRSRGWASSCLRCHHDYLRSQSLWPPPSVSGGLHSPPWPWTPASAWPACPHTPRYSHHYHRGNPVIRELSFVVSYFCMEGMCRSIESIVLF